MSYSANGRASTLLEYQRELAQSQIPEESIFKPGYVDSLLCRQSIATAPDTYKPCGLYKDHTGEHKVVERYDGI